MTTTTDPGAAGMSPGSGYPPAPPRPLRRSAGDRMVSGIAGGLGEYFGVDAVIFRVLFAVLSFFGGVGLLLYGLAWLLVPEAGVEVSALDRGIAQLRARRVPPWLVIIGGAILLWVCWFSWWAPGPTFPAVMLVAVLALVLVHRLRTRPIAPAPAAGAADAGAAAPADADTVPGGQDPAGTTTQPGFAPFGWQPPAPAGPLIAPLGDTRRSMQAWLSEAGEAHRARVQRRRPIKVGAGLGLAAAWAALALADAFNRVPFPAYLWVGLAVLSTCLVISLLTRRMTLSLLIPIAVLAVIAIGLGGTRSSLRDGSGRIGWMPTSAAQLSDERQFAGQSTLDLSRLPVLSAAQTVSLTQAAGEVLLRIPNTLNATVISDVHLGDVQDGTSHGAGSYVGGQNVHLQLSPAAGARGEPLTIRVHLTLGHVQVDRVG